MKRTWCSAHIVGAALHAGGEIGFQLSVGNPGEVGRGLRGES